MSYKCILIAVLFSGFLSLTGNTLEVSAGGANLQNRSAELQYNSKLQSLIAVVEALGRELRQSHDCMEQGKIYNYHTDSCADHPKIKAMADCTKKGDGYNYVNNTCVSTPNGMPKNTIAGFYQNLCPPNWRSFDMAKGKFLVGVGPGKYTLGNMGGTDKVRLNIKEMPTHRHYNSKINAIGKPYAQRFVYTARKSRGYYPTLMSYSGSHQLKATYTSYQGSNYKHENRPPYVAVKWCIKE